MNCLCCGKETKRKWKNKPVCKECTEDARDGKTFWAGSVRERLININKKNVASYKKNNASKEKK